MSLRYLLDTNICIYIAKARPKEVLARFRRLQPGAVGMSVITYGELCHGACKSRHQPETERILLDLTRIIPVVEIDEATGRCYGEIRAELERAGRLIGNNDMWIAAHALSLGVTLVTNNEKEFSRVPGLAVSNWVRRSSGVHEKPAQYSRR